MTLSNEITAQIDEAFDFRGHVTVSFNDGKTLEGYLFNRELTPMKGEAYIEMIPKDDHLLVENLTVAPAFQGRGLGQRLMAHAEQVAASLGYGEVRLYTNRLFVANVDLYRWLGYRVDAEEVFSGGIVVHMSKSVAATGATA